VFLAPLVATAISIFSGLILVTVGLYSVVGAAALSTLVGLAIVSIAYSRGMATPG
jgi:hypothetical protein